jgi:hypothetical protein
MLLAILSLEHQSARQDVAEMRCTFAVIEDMLQSFYMIPMNSIQALNPDVFKEKDGKCEDSARMWLSTT